MNDDLGDLSTYYSDIERKILQRCREGEPVSADDLLTVLSADLLLTKKRSEDIIKTIERLTTIDQNLTDKVDDLSCISIASASAVRDGGQKIPRSLKSEGSLSRKTRTLRPGRSASSATQLNSKRQVVGTLVPGLRLSQRDDLIAAFDVIDESEEIIAKLEARVARLMKAWLKEARLKEPSQ